MDAPRTTRRGAGAARAIVVLLVLLTALAALAPGGRAQEATPQAAGGQAPTDVQLILIHGAADLGLVDVYLDGQLVAPGFGFAAVTDPAIATTSGTRQVQVVPAGAALEAAVLTGELSFAAGRTYEVVLVGPAAQLQAAAYEKDVTPVEPRQARLRFVHASPDAGALDITATTGLLMAGNLGFLQASPYMTIEAGTYTFEARAAGTDAVTLTLPDTVLNGGTVYDIVLVGSLADGTLSNVVAATLAGTPARASRPANIHQGACDALDPNPLYPLSDVILTAGAAAGSEQATPVETSYTTVPVDLATLLQGAYAVNVQESQTQIGNSVACGEIGGVAEPDGSIAIGLRELNGSGLSGVAVLRPTAGNPATTDVAIYLAEGPGAVGGETAPAATPAAAAATPAA